MLETILAHKHAEIEKAQRIVPIAVLEKQLEDMGSVRSLLRSITGENGPRHRVIAEIKRASPSKGVFREDLEPASWAQSYQRAGAAALSVLTDERFFKGSLQHLQEVRRCVDLPLLRKDFILDPYQILEARCNGADAILLIVRALDTKRFKQLLRICRDVGLETLVEVHTEEELNRALEEDAPLVGINNRDLKSFNVDISVTERLMPRIPSGTTVISASGIKTKQHVERLESTGVKAFLVGEALVTSSDPEKKLRELVS